MASQNEPRVRIVVSPRGIERIEVWGADDEDQDAAMQLYWRLSGHLRVLNQACHA